MFIIFLVRILLVNMGMVFIINYLCLMLLKGYGYVIYLICATVMERWRTGKYESMPGASRASRGQEVRVAGPHSPSPSHSSPQPAFAPPLPPHTPHTDRYAGVLGWVLSCAGAAGRCELVPRCHHCARVLPCVSNLACMCACTARMCECIRLVLT